LSICITLFGEVPEGRALRRDGARTGDDVWVSGEVGDAALALARSRAAHGSGANDSAFDDAPREALERPVPRIALGLALRSIATSAIDVSDGLAQDLGHILTASKIGATLDASRVPVSGTLAREGDEVRYRCALAGGDDYQLCFTAPQKLRDAVEDAGRNSATRVTRIGAIDADMGLHFVDADGADFRFPDGLNLHGFDHFA
ncbi:MAG: thiamine-phosphate kinase, partial [Burkholderiaceae bacterium]